ncbi:MULTISPECIES: serine hydrolase domain-containing protein [unclassified Myroides]|uniref:serine hydrolase domain-containing protein n=1 Tax=unclassified Myroides TaxID=2642485 RepID=UPI003D2F5656
MNTKLTIALVSLLALASCKQQQDATMDLALNMPIIKEHNVFIEKSYETAFQELKPEYILEKGQQIEDFYNQYINKSGYTGSFLVAQNGKILYEHYSGYANKKQNEAITENTPIHVASVGKVVTAITILRLVQEGLIHLDQPVSELIDGFPYEDITIRTLLSHRSGLKYYGYYPNGKWSSQNVITNDQVIDVIKSKSVALDFKPNTRFTYSNTNYVVLASIAEKVTGKKFKQVVRDLIFDPLEMNHSFVFDDITHKREVTQSYNSNYREMHWDYMDGTYGDKNIYTTPRDMLKLDTAMYSDDFLNADLKTQMTEGYSFESKGIRNYGLGLRLIKMKNDKNYTYHNGWWRGNTSSYIRLADSNACIILFSNKYSKLTYKTIDLSHYLGDYPVGNVEL